MSTAPDRSDRRAKIQAAAPKQRNLLPWLAALVVLALVGGGIALALLQNRQSTQAVDKAAANLTVPPHANADRSGIVVNPGRTKDGAPVVTLFQDYQCPACKRLEDMYGESLKKLAEQGKYRLEYHTMTFLDTNLRNDASTRAAQAAACADTVGAYSAYHDEIYRNQPTQEGVGYTDAQLTGAFAQAAGITGDRLATFKACYADKKMADWVVGTNDKAGKANVTSTPTLRANGKDVDLRGVTSPADFEARLLAALK